MLESGWKRRNHSNIKLFWYEELQENQKKMIKEICQFISYELSEEQIDRFRIKLLNYKVITKN